MTTIDPPNNMANNTQPMDNRILYERFIQPFINVDPNLIGDILPTQKEFYEIFLNTDFQTRFKFRTDYVKNISFQILTQEYLDEIISVFKKFGIDSFIEAYAGTGIFTTILLASGFDGKAVSLPLDEDLYYKGTESAVKFRQFLLSRGNFIEKDLKHVEEKAHCVIASWIPYEGGDELINYLEKKHAGEYLYVVTEGRGGCVASDNFFDYLYDNYELVHTITNFTKFPLIYDEAELYRRKF